MLNSSEPQKRILKASEAWRDALMEEVRSLRWEPSASEWTGAAGSLQSMAWFGAVVYVVSNIQSRVAI